MSTPRLVGLVLPGTPPAAPPPSLAPLAEPVRWLLLLAFGLSTSWALGHMGMQALPAFDRLLGALSLSLLVTGALWFIALALQRGTWWTIAMLVPYVNFIAIAWFARRYWYGGARAPSLLLLGSSLVQLVLIFHWILQPHGPVLA